jgi:hypothetical protein
MSQQIKKYNFILEWGNGYADPCATGSWVDYADHKASHAFDEEAERPLFEAEHREQCGLTGTDLESEFDRDDAGCYIYTSTAEAWSGWLMCAKSRAKRFGGAV